MSRFALGEIVQWSSPTGPVPVEFWGQRYDVAEPMAVIAAPAGHAQGERLLVPLGELRPLPVEVDRG